MFVVYVVIGYIYQVNEMTQLPNCISNEQGKATLDVSIITSNVLSERLLDSARVNNKTDQLVSSCSKNADSRI